MDKLSRACRDGNVKSVQQLLLNPNVDPSANENEAITEAVRNGHTRVVQLLLSTKGPYLWEDYDCAIFIAVREGHHKITKLLLQHDHPCVSTEDDSSDIELLETAIWHRRTDVVHLLLQDRRLSLSTDNNRLLHLAAEAGCAHTAQLLLQDGRLDPASEDKRSLWIASMFGYDDIVRLLVRDGRVHIGINDTYALQRALGNRYMFAMLQYHACEAMATVV